MKLMTETDVLDLGFRKKVIEEIKGPENVARKMEHLRRAEVYKDKTLKWIAASLRSEGLKDDTIRQMMNRATNISICRKIVNKLARAYSGGVERSGDTEAETEAINEMADFLHMTDKMRKSDRYRELHKNCVAQFVQEQSGGTAESPQYRVGMRILAPWQYDIIEDCYDREIPRCFITSDFFERNVGVNAASEDEAGRHATDRMPLNYTNKKDDIIADAPSDSGEGSRQIFIWWTDQFHFTTYDDGTYCEQLTPEGYLNPIQMLPFVNNAEEQDSQFWAQGGDDIVDGSILVNKMMTDMNFIAYLQGYGTFVITGKNLKDRYSLGPNNAWIFDYDKEEDPKPEVTVVAANPPLGDWRQMVEQYVALLLTTNNLSPTSVSGTLTAVNAASGIAKLIDSSEATNDVTDKKEEYADQERRCMIIVQAWQAVLVRTDECDPEFKALPMLPENVGETMTTNFIETKAPLSEGERLANMKLRKDLGIATLADLVKLDNPDLNDDQAAAKVAELRAANPAPVAPPAQDQQAQDQQQQAG